MSQMLHNIIGGILSTVIWEIFIKDYFHDEEEMKKCLEFIRRIFYK